MDHLNAEQLRALVDVSRRARKVRRAAAVARFGGWTGAVFAAITLVSAVFSFALALSSSYPGAHPDGGMGGGARHEPLPGHGAGHR